MRVTILGIEGSHKPLQEGSIPSPANRRHSSVVEQRFCKPSVLGSNPSAGSILLASSSVVERSAVNRLVVGSSPTLPAILSGLVHYLMVSLFHNKSYL
jgi:hypothetical protein